MHVPNNSYEVYWRNANNGTYFNIAALSHSFLNFALGVLGAYFTADPTLQQRALAGGRLIDGLLGHQSVTAE